MNDAALGLFIVAGLFTLVLVFGLITGSMGLPPDLRFERDKEPFWYWAATSIDALLAVIALYSAIASL